jgi:tetratricopeptide (TPR) repeat protein
VIAINPDDYRAYKSRGFIKGKLGKNQEAILDYDRAIAINPNFPEVYGLRGLIKYNLEDKKGAVLDLKRAAELFRQQGNIDEYQSAIDLAKKIEE